jgi:hypothetical protein
MIVSVIIILDGVLKLGIGGPRIDYGTSRLERWSANQSTTVFRFELKTRREETTWETKL